ncbi:MAG: hypothetical protein ABIB61_02415 [Candidatus Shapirobacteria bacterium]
MKISWKNVSLFLITALLITLFLFFRLYKIKTSLLFAVDMGRDLLALRLWWEKGTPPLLGPQTSTIPFNQSALYFYLLYPLFLITKHSPFSTIYTCSLIYISFFIVGVFLLKNRPAWLKSLFVAWLLLSLQPQFIIQHRFVWNPSFVAPFLMAAFYFFAKLLERYSLKTLILFSLGLTTAVSLSFSVAPVFIAYVFFAFLKLRKKFIPLVLSLGASLFILNLPTLFFELRHQFTLAKQMLTYPRLAQEQTDIIVRSSKLFQYTISPYPPFWPGIILLAIISIGIYLLLKNRSQSKAIRESQILLRQALFLLAATLFFTFIIPWDMQSHFIFGILTLGIIIISLLPYQTLAPILILILALWLRPTQAKSYFNPANRTVEETQECAQKVCAQEKDPLFLSVQSGLFPYHTGQTFRFLFKEAGCNIRAIETEPQSAQKMALIVEESRYNPEKTSFYELTLFGPKKEIKKYECLDNLQVYILEKISP